MTKKCNLIREDMCMVEGIPKENIITLTKEITMGSTAYQFESIEIPTEFTVDNTVVLSVMHRAKDDEQDRWHCGYSYFVSGGGYIHSISTSVLTNSTFNGVIVSLYGDDLTGGMTYEVKVTLMRID